MKKLLLSLATLLVLSANCIVAQNITYNYISPLPSSKYINPEQTIVLRTGVEFDNSSLTIDNFIISGNLSGIHSFDINLMDDKKTLIITPDSYFLYGETVDITIKSGIQTITEKSISGLSYSFTIKPIDNLPLLVEFYKREAAKNMPVAHNETKSTLNPSNNKLPNDYPGPEMIHYNETDKGLLFFTLNPRGGAPWANNYLSINDEYGIPLFFRKTESNTLYFHAMLDGKLAYAKNQYGSPENERYFFMDSSYMIVDSIKTGNGYDMDGHDILLMDNGHYVLLSYDPQPVDMSLVVPGGNPNATVIGLVIQEVDINENVYFQWRSWDHFEITDATHDINLYADEIDCVHGNAFAFDTDGNLLISSRHLDEITKINSETGEIIYRFGLLSKNNQFEFQNDAIGFSHQHDIKVLPNGNITIFDNGNLHSTSYSRALEYSINESDKTANLEWFYRNDPDIYGMATGSYRRDEEGKHLIGWGSTWPISATELLPDNSKSMEVILPTGVYSYRVVKYEWKTNLFRSLSELNLGNFSGKDDPKQMILPIFNNFNKQIRITSFHLHNQVFNLNNQMPVIIDVGDTVNIIVDYFPSDTGSFTDRLTLNYDQISLSGTERVAIQIELSGIWDSSLPVVSFIPEFNAQDIDPNTSIDVSFSEPVKMWNGSMIQDSDIPNIFNIKLHNQWGLEIPFTGYISEDFMNIVLYPTGALSENESYYVELNESVLYDFDDNHLDYTEATYFTTGKFVGNDEIIALNKVKIFPLPFNDDLTIQFPEGLEYTVNIVDMSGYCLFERKKIVNKIKVKTSNFPIGVYIVKTIDEHGNTDSFKAVKN